MASIALNFGEENPISNQIGDDQWINLCLTTGIAVVLVLLGGLFAGLTLAFMGQDKVYLQVLRISGTEREKRDASKVLRVLQHGKHWILVTLLVSNVITNETLPIVLDHWLSSGWPAILTSTILVLLFGEIIPQSVCAKYGLRIGANTSTFLRILMYLLSPVTYPIARLLDWFLGEDDGIVFGKRRLKTLISLQKSLSEEEVTIVSAALDLKETQVSSIMTPLSQIFALGSEVQLNELLRHKLWASGFNQIPVHAPGDPTKFVGVVFAKDLIINESGQITTVKEMNIAHLPVVSPDLSCLDMLKFFRSGMSRMVLVTECGTNGGRAIGILTIRNVIENLINCNL